MPATTRRTVLGAASVAVATLAGCLGTETVDPPVAERRESTTTAAASTTATEREPVERDDPATPEPTRPRGAPISVRERFTDGDSYTYLEDRNVVRYVSAYRHANREAVENGSASEREPVYDTMSFERWGEVRCASTAANAVGETTAERLGHEELDASVRVGSRGGVLAVVVARTVTYDRQGNRISATEVPFDDLVAAAPRRVDATVSLAGREYDTTVPVWATYFEQWQQ
ncbi:hypothetical protein [Salinigranum salinum]|uniref:hypothetical protein n=1 Tax=Salinigranum salinum TaxID=1364937 RepID=UPI0012607C71|nr:hypothetical protein [Salinigranum salinum]